MIGLHPRSIRFKLTAWYAAALTIGVIVLAVLIATLLERRLYSNFDQELSNTALAVYDTARVAQDFDGGPLTYDIPALDPFSTAGYFVQLYDITGSPKSTYRSASLGDRNLPFWSSTSGPQSRSFHSSEIDGESIRLVNVPLRPDIPGVDQTIAILVVAAPSDRVDSTVEEIRKITALGAIIAVVVTVLGGWFLAGRALRPVERMRIEAENITSDRTTGRPILAERIKDPGTNDEISRLAQTFNELLDRIEAAFDTERRFIADASHELRTPLTAIRGNVDVLLRQADRAGAVAPEEMEALTDMQREADRMSRLLTDLLTLARADSASGDDLTTLSPVSLASPVYGAARTAQALAPDREIIVELDADPRTVANPDQIEQVALILLDNAIRHSTAPNPVTIRLTTSSAWAEIVVIDRGEGIAPEHLPHLFDRFYRVDTMRSRRSGGTGLGLAIGDAIVSRHGGHIDVVSAQGVGTTFTVQLPITTVAPADSTVTAG